MTSDATAGSLTGVILAGGKSTRFGADKASARLGGRPLLQWAVTALGEACDEIIVVAAPGQALPAVDSTVPLLTVVDRVPGAGPLGGLVTGLAAAANDACFATSCDAPLLRPALVRLLATMAGGIDVVCPYVAGRLQPLASVYATYSCLPILDHEVGSGNLKMTGGFGHLRVRRVAEDELRAADPALDSFINVNEPGLLRQLEARLASRGS